MSKKKEKSASPIPPAPEQKPEKKYSKSSAYSAILSSVEDAHKWAKGENGVLYWYESGRYVPDDAHGSYLARMIHKRLSTYGGEPINEGEYFEKIRSHLVRMSPLLWNDSLLAKSKVCLRNGLLNLEKMELEPHTPDWISPVQLNAEWNPEAKGEGWRKFLERLFPKEYLPFVGEAIGACLTPDRSVQSAIWLKGTGSNGKSTFMMAVERMLGRDNVVSFSIAALDKNPFVSAEFYGKLLAIDYDTKDIGLENADTFKKLIAGDPIMAQRKFAHPFQFEPKCKMVYCGNSLPKSKDFSFGFSRRFTIVEMLRRFEPGKDGFEGQEDILGRLGEKDERSWILLQAALGWGRLKKNGTWSEVEQVKAATERFRMNHHPFVFWMRDHILEQKGVEVEEGELLEKVNVWMRKKGYSEVGEGQLGKLMETLLPEARKEKASWKGIGLV